MNPFTIRLTDDERVKLEGHRVRLGVRSEADVIRHWIKVANAKNDPVETTERPAYGARLKKR